LPSPGRRLPSYIQNTQTPSDQVHSPPSVRRLGLDHSCTSQVRPGSPPVYEDPYEVSEDGKTEYIPVLMRGKIKIANFRDIVVESVPVLGRQSELNSMFDRDVKLQHTRLPMSKTAVFSVRGTEWDD